nr:MAG TPA: hypothetical protein [Caudoviricetes sp.]
MGGGVTLIFSNINICKLERDGGKKGSTYILYIPSLSC